MHVFLCCGLFLVYKHLIFSSISCGSCPCMMCSEFCVSSVMSEQLDSVEMHRMNNVKFCSLHKGGKRDKTVAFSVVVYSLCKVKITHCVGTK
jgi:hypothetical protein